MNANDSNDGNNTNEEKITNENPVSLNPLSLSDALRSLLAIPPMKEPKNETQDLAEKQHKKKPKPK